MQIIFRFLLCVLVLWSVLPCAVCRADISTGLVGWWKLNEGSGSNAHDSSGNADTGALQNSPPWVSGKDWPYALSFNGSNQFVDVPNAANLNFTSGQSYTISIWAYPTSIPGTWGGAITKARAIFNYYYGIWLNPGGNWVFGHAGDNLFGPIAVTNTWQHVVCVYNAGTNSLYFNGVFQSSDIFSTASSGASDLNIGRSDVGEYFLGYLDDVRLYNRALSATDILELYYYRPSTNQFSHAHLAHFHTTLQ